MNDLSVIVGQNEQRTREKLVEKLKAEGYHVVYEKQQGTITIGEIRAFRTAGEGRAKLAGVKGDWVAA